MINRIESYWLSFAPETNVHATISLIEVNTLFSGNNPNVQTLAPSHLSAVAPYIWQYRLGSVRPAVSPSPAGVEFDRLQKRLLFVIFRRLMTI